MYCTWQKTYTVKPVYNDHPWDPKIVAVVDRWSLFRGHLSNKKFKLGPLNGGRCRLVLLFGGGH